MEGSSSSLCFSWPCLLPRKAATPASSTTARCPAPTDPNYLHVLPAHPCGQTLLPSSSHGSMLCSGLAHQKVIVLPKKAPAMPAPALPSLTQGSPSRALLPSPFPALLPDPLYHHLAHTFPPFVACKILALEHRSKEWQCGIAQPGLPLKGNRRDGS